MERRKDEIEKMVWFNLLSQAYLENGIKISGVVRKDEKNAAVDGHKPVNAE